MRARGWRWRTPCASPTLRFHVFISVPYYTFFIYFTLFVSAPRLVALRVQAAPCIFPFAASSGVYPFLLLPCPFLLLPPRAAGVSVGSGSGAIESISSAALVSTSHHSELLLLSCCKIVINTGYRIPKMTRKII